MARLAERLDRSGLCVHVVLTRIRRVEIRGAPASEVHPVIPDSAREVDSSIRIDEGKRPLGFPSRVGPEEGSAEYESRDEDEPPGHLTAALAARSTG